MSTPTDSSASSAFNPARQKQLIRTVTRGLMVAVGGVALLFCVWMIWIHWLSPWGKMAWQLKEKCGKGEARYLSAKPDQLIALLGDRALAVEPQSGKVIWRQKILGTRLLYVREDAAGYLFQTDEKISRIKADGTTAWTVGNRAEWTILAHTPTAILIQAEHYEARKTTPQEKQKLAEQLKKLSKNQRQRLLKFREKWNRRRVISLLSLATANGKETWKATMPEGIKLVSADLNEKSGILCTAQWRDHQYRVRLRGFNPETGKKVWSAKLDQCPASGPFLRGDKIIWGEGKFLHTYTVNGEAVSTTDWDRKSILRTGQSPAGGVTTKEEAPGEVRRIDNGLVLYDKKSGKYAWSWKLAGGVRAWAEDPKNNIVVAVGHSTAEGGSLDENFDAGAQALGLDGPLKKMVANQVSVNDWALVALQRDSGKERWRKEKLAGIPVCGSGRIVLLQDTAKTSMHVRTSNAKGVLILHQFRPTDGKLLYSREFSEFRLTHPRIFNQRLVAITFERTPANKHLSRRAPPTGLIAFRLK